MPHGGYHGYISGLGQASSTGSTGGPAGMGNPPPKPKPKPTTGTTSGPAGMGSPPPKPKPKPTTGTTSGPAGMGSPPPKPKPKPTTTTTSGPAGMGSPPPKTKPKPKKIEYEIPKDFKRKRKAFQAVSFFFPKIKASLGAPEMRFGSDWQKRNAQQHLMFTAMNPILATIHEFPGFAGFDEAEKNQDLYNNALRDEVLNRAQEIDARKGKKGLTTPSTDAIEQASFNMVNEQSERMESGLEFSSTLPNIRPYQKYTNKKVPSLFSPMKSRLNEVALNISNKLINWGN